MSALRAKISCEKCGHAETAIVSAQVHLEIDDQGERVLRQTVYSLRCTNGDCQHFFQATVPADEEQAL